MNRWEFVLNDPFDLNLYFCGKNWKVYCIYVLMNVSCPDREDVITINQEVFSIRSIGPHVFECWGSDWENPSCCCGGCSGPMMMTHQTFLIIHLCFFLFFFNFLIDKPFLRSTIYTLRCLLAQCSASVWICECLKNHKPCFFVNFPVIFSEPLAKDVFTLLWTNVW